MKFSPTIAVAALLACAPLAWSQDSSTKPANAAAGTAAAPAAAQPKKPAKAGAADTKAGASDKAKASYSLGVSMGDQLHHMGISPDAVSAEQITQGLRDALAGKATMSQEHQDNIANFIKTARTNLADANRAKAKAFLAENGKKPDIKTTASGLQYKVVSPGDGASPKSTDQVTVNYRGTLLDGTEFDSSYKRGKPASFPVGHHPTVSGTGAATRIRHQRTALDQRL